MFVGTGDVSDVGVREAGVTGGEGRLGMVGVTGAAVDVGRMVGEEFVPVVSKDVWVWVWVNEIDSMVVGKGSLVNVCLVIVIVIGPVNVNLPTPPGDPPLDV